uniref:Uncharacterized protein n=1 Tax=Panagrolaimus superbus TaxID=310955 RepID=A0A914YXX8_9BILA
MTDFLLKNETINFHLEYDCNAVLSDEYKEDLENFIAKIVETPPKRIPHIDFLGFENSIFYDDYQKLF